MKFTLTRHARAQLKNRFNFLPNEIKKFEKLEPVFVCSQWEKDRMYSVDFMGYKIFLPCAPNGSDEMMIKTVLEDYQAAITPSVKSEPKFYATLTQTAGEVKHKALVQSLADEKKRQRKAKHEQMLEMHRKQKAQDQLMRMKK